MGLRVALHVSFVEDRGRVSCRVGLKVGNCSQTKSAHERCTALNLPSQQLKTFTALFPPLPPLR